MTCTFMQFPVDTDEEGRYAMEEAEREWEKEALESQRRSRTSSFLNTAGSFIRNVSVSGEWPSLTGNGDIRCVELLFNTARRMSISSPYVGVPCDWTWEQLEGREVMPPFKPILVSLECHWELRVLFLFCVAFMRGERGISPQHPSTNEKSLYWAATALCSQLGG